MSDDSPPNGNEPNGTPAGGQPFEPWDPRRHLDRRRPTTAEQAVPWLIGIILAQTGMLIVLLALIFTGPGGVATGSPTPSPVTFTPGPSSSPPGSGEPSASGEPSPALPTPTPAPSFGPLEIVYLGRPSAAAPIDLLRRDFSITGEPTVVKRDSSGVDRMVWSADGQVGVALISGRVVAFVEDQPERELATGVSAVTFGPDATTLYAVRTVRNGSNDTTSVLEIDVVSGGTTTVASVTYLHPVIVNDPPLREAQYADNGGVARIWYTTTDALVMYLLGAPSVYRIDPASGAVTNATRQPVLASPDRRWEIRIVEKSTSSSTIELHNRVTGDLEATVPVSGLVSHVRWASASNEIVFTLGFLSSGGGVRQDLYVWDLQDGHAAAALTGNGASFGAEWLGSPQAWYE